MMTTGYVIGIQRRKLLVACAVMLTVAIAGFASLGSAEVNSFIALASLTAAVYALCVAISWHRPPIVIAFVGLILNLLLVLDFGAPETEIRSGASPTNVAVNAGEAVASAIASVYGQIMLLVASLVLLAVVLTQSRWGPMMDSQDQ
jgi:hypothetical protein